MARVEALPARAAAMVEAMACLGGRVDLSVLQAATGEPAAALAQALAPALDEGLLVMEPGARRAVRFRHDRIRHAILQGLDPRRRHALQLAMARRLAGGAGAVRGGGGAVPAGRRRRRRRRRSAVRWCGLLRRAADQARLIGDHVLVDALLGAALQLADPDETATLVALRTARHAALYSMGRLDEADEEYRTIETLCPTALTAGGRDGTCRCAASPTASASRRRSGWAWSRCASSASPCRRRTGAPRSSTGSSSTCTGGWTTATSPTTWPGRRSPTRRCSPRPV